MWQKTMNKKTILAAVLALGCMTAYADEGMWMVNAISRALVQKMQAEGCQLDGKAIYDVDEVSLSDAIVSLDFGCTGSMVSETGLLITNHHCAYSDVHALSTAEHNYLEEGFWAQTADQEIYIPGKSAYFLQKVLDVTDEVNELIEQEKSAGRAFGSRRISYLMETKYSKQTGLEASLSSMWAGSRYYLALYKVYTDLRLVAAPPVSIAAFGGDVDNWEWPQHKCDFAMYRIYAAPDGSPAPHADTNVPWKPDNFLRISTAGYNPGSFAMVMGYPGRTDRYSSSAKVRYQQDLALPITNKIRGDQMNIIMKWMNADPAVRLKYADRYFTLSNIQENNEGLRDCCKRFGVVKSKKNDEKRLLKGKDNKQLLQSLNYKYNAIRNAEKNVNYYRETLVRGTRVALIASKLKNSKSRLDMEKEYDAIDLRVEKELFRYSLETFYENVDSVMWSPYQVKVREIFRKDKEVDWDGLCDYLWTNDFLTKNDRLFQFFNDANIRDYNLKIDEIEGTESVAELGKRFTRAMYQAREGKGELQYPDANSTMRLTYGTVGTFKRDGAEVPWKTSSKEILLKEDPSQYDFTLKDDWRNMLQDADPIPVNFITDNDITGGNSGSPVLNGKGEIIGLAFDGNKESLASDVRWVDGWCKCVCVDIRFVLWTLENYMHLDRVMDELTLED